MTMPLFMFATGIENSYPTIRNGRHRADEMEKCGHYEHWRTDFELVADLDIHFLRYGPPIHRTWLGHRRYDWEFADLTFGYLKGLDIVPIVDLCHFGVPDWIGDFQNPDFPKLFAEYACALGAALHAGERNVRLRAVLRRLRLVERAAPKRRGLRDGAQAHRQG
jgi:beta-glucosidase